MKFRTQKFRTQFDPKYKPDEGEVNNEDSKTVPDDCLSLRQLLINHSRGINSNVSNNEGIYSGDTEIPVFMDINDKVEYQNELLQKEKELSKQIEKERDDKKKKEAEKATGTSTDDSKEKIDTGLSEDKKGDTGGS